MKQKRIILSVTNDLVTDQRVHRSCLALMEAGYEVTLVGRRLRSSQPIQRPYRTHRMRLMFNKKALFYAEYNLRLFFLLLFSRADLYFANDTDTLLANYLAAKLRGKKLFFDSHELFPDTPELVERERVRRVWQWLERKLIPRTDARCTVCHSCAEVLEQRYGLPFGVVRNVPLRSPQKAEPHRVGEPYLLLYQGALNLGRGIEETLAAMPHLPECRFLIAGIGDHYERLRQMAHHMGLDSQVKFLGRLPLEQLREVTLKAHLGLAILQDLGLSYRCALPNRLSDFVQAGVPTLATAFPEPQRIIEQYGVGTLIPVGLEKDPLQLATAIRAALQQWDSVAPDERRSRFERAANDLCWENDKKTLVNAINRLFQS